MLKRYGRCYKFYNNYVTLGHERKIIVKNTLIILFREIYALKL